MILLQHRSSLDVVQVAWQSLKNSQLIQFNFNYLGMYSMYSMYSMYTVLYVINLFRYKQGLDCILYYAS